MTTTTRALPAPFAWLTLSQSLGALNDNLFKLLAIFRLISIHGAEHVVTVSAIAGAVFVAPFLLLSPLAGSLADRFPKHRVFRTLKVTEVFVMALGVFFFVTGSSTGLYVVMFLMSAQSALLSPSKLGLIPEIVGTDNVPKANGFMVAATYLAIIVGTAAASVVSLAAGAQAGLAAASCVAVALAGMWCAMHVTRGPHQRDAAAAPQNVFTKVLTAVRTVRADRGLSAAVAGSAAFLFAGAFTQLSILPFGMDVLGLGRELSGALFLLTALGIGAGATVAGLCSRHVPQTGLAPVGAAGIALSAYGLAAVQGGLLTTVPLLAVLGFCGGLFMVPLNALVQVRSPEEHRGSVLALSNLLNFVGVLAASGAVWMLGTLGIDIAAYFLVVACTGVMLAVFLAMRFRREVARTVIATLTALHYRVEPRNLSNLPPTGPVVLLANHVSWVDALLLGVATPRPVRFLMAREMYRTPWFWPLAKFFGAIPISYGDGPHALQESLEAARRVLDSGEVLGIFPEANIVPHGFMDRFRKGYRSIVDQSRARLVPVYLDGLWGSVFSYWHGRTWSHRPTVRRRTVTVSYGAPRGTDTPPHVMRQAVAELSADAMVSRYQDSGHHLGREFVTVARRSWSREALTDTTGKKVTFGTALIGSVVLARIFRRRMPENMVGVVLPATVGGALANLGLTLAGKVPVNLNFTSSRQALGSAAHQCGLKHIITSKRFLSKLEGVELPVEPVYLEDVSAGVTKLQKVCALLAARFGRINRLARGAGGSEPATVIFSSGSTAEPKGIVLSHNNVRANTESMSRAIAVDHTDGVCAALPFFHSFGYTATLWFPMLAGFKANYHPNPLDGEGIASVVRENKSTILLATPTFLRSYIRKATREDFASLRYAIVGAEKLRTELADQFEERLGLRPLEGYGATELSPVAALNSPDLSRNCVRFRCNKPGAIGRPLPGVAMKVVDPDTAVELQTGEPGMLLVKGANVMTGYLHNEIKTAEVLRDGWYVTGDIATIDEDGFVTLTDRLSRFSKIAGEMVPHGAVEEALQAVLNTPEPVVAVTAVADDRRGEKLVVLYTPEAGGRDAVADATRAADLPNLWRPARDALVPVDAIPVLGTGKTDLKMLKQIAREWAEGGVKVAA